MLEIIVTEIIEQNKVLIEMIKNPNVSDQDIINFILEMNQINHKIIKQ